MLISLLLNYGQPEFRRLSGLCCHALVTQHRVWIGNCMTATNYKYNAVANSRTLRFAITAIFKRAPESDYIGPSLPHRVYPFVALWDLNPARIFSWQTVKGLKGTRKHLTSIKPKHLNGERNLEKKCLALPDEVF
jgi:hypothetical protein